LNEEHTSFEDGFRIESQGLDDAPVSGNSRYSRRRSRSVGTIKVIALVGVVIALLVVMVIVFKNTGSKASVPEKTQGDTVAGNLAMISLLEQRMERMESAFAGILEKVSTTTKAGPTSEADINVFSDRVDRVENAMSAKFNILVENLDKLDIQMADALSRIKTLEGVRGGRPVAREKSQISVAPVKTAVEPGVSTGKTTSQSSVATTGDKKSALKKNRPATEKKSASPHVYHVIQKGDTLYSISKKYDTTVENLHKLNHFSTQPTIYPGNKLIVK